MTSAVTLAEFEAQSLGPHICENRNRSRTDLVRIACDHFSLIGKSGRIDVGIDEENPPTKPGDCDGSMPDRKDFNSGENLSFTECAVHGNIVRRRHQPGRRDATLVPGTISDD